MTHLTVQLTDLERLVAIEEIKQLQARRVRSVDTKDWTVYAACHAPDIEHESNVVKVSGREQLLAAVSKSLARATSIHHMHSPEIDLTSDTTARAVWVMQDTVIRETERGAETKKGFAYSHETYRKEDGRWVVATRRIERVRMEVSVQT